MTDRHIIERRDPVSPLLQLGGALASARLEKRSGRIRVLDDDEAFIVSIYCGSIVNFSAANPSWSDVHGRPVLDRVSRLFRLSRPRVIWDENNIVVNRVSLMNDPAQAIVSGVRSRMDLFNPVSLVERIPVPALSVDPITVKQLSRLPFTGEEIEFLARLTTPTPVTMILWKRGLVPRHAGALLMTLNLLGIWRDVWQPGQLPREVLRETVGEAPVSHVSDIPCDFAALGVPKDASDKDVDLAFRKLSKEMHPDRQAKLPANLAHDAFADLSAAYTRVKRSRRSRPVAHTAARAGRADSNRSEDGSWLYYYQQARQAHRDQNVSRARAFAVKTLAGRPPQRVRDELMSWLGRVA